MASIMPGETTIYITEIDRQRLEKLIEIASQRDDAVNREYLPSGLRRIKVEELLYQPEAAGDYNL
jgi:Rnk N-terminus